MRKLLALLATIATCVALSLPASADGAGTVTMTQTFHNATVSFPAANPCSGAAGTVTTTFNGVVHLTFLTAGIGAGTGWGTFTNTGDFILVPIDPSQPTFTGHFTVWDGFSFNLQNFAATGILVIHGTGSDGSTLTFHDVMHVTVLDPTSSTPTIVVSFDKPTCG